MTSRWMIQTRLWKANLQGRVGCDLTFPIDLDPWVSGLRLNFHFRLLQYHFRWRYFRQCSRSPLACYRKTLDY